MVMVVAPISATISRIRSLMTPDMIGSRPVVGSSKKMISGSAAMARARLTRFCIPPDNSAGKRSATSGARPTRRSFSMAISFASVLGRLSDPRKRRKATFCQTGRLSNSAPPWNSIPKRARKASRGWVVTSTPSTVMTPESGSTRPRMHLIRIDLPVPEPPITTVLVPLGTFRSIPRRTLLAPKALCKLESVIMPRRTPP